MREAVMSILNNVGKVERWDVFELSMDGSGEGNPFVDLKLTASFIYKHRVVEVEGFYDGDGLYMIRFMPDAIGLWTYETRSTCPDLNGIRGEFDCVVQTHGNHGPVRVKNTYHFAYEDGKPYFPVGTTCYVWNHQGDELEELTLKTLKTAPFNKIRMCVFPKHYDYNHNEPQYYPFEKAKDGSWDFKKFDPAFFWHLERRIEDLKDLGIEADLILFHPYDRWGFATMDMESNERYLRYLVARLSAYRNIWWSFANEYDLMPNVSMPDWDKFFHVVQECDHVQHLRSIHNCREFYDHGKPWVTHSSIQHSDMVKTAEWREQYKKPVVVDECCYEGNINWGWGNITAQEMVCRFWEGTVRGGYVGHGETYMHPDEILWWSKGGALHGQSPERIGFLKKILEEGPDEGLNPLASRWDSPCAGKDGEYYLMYFGNRQPSFKLLDLPAENRYKVEVIDTWDMTVRKLEGEYCTGCRVELPAKLYIALRIRKS
jgi:hypothetical protein